MIENWFSTKLSPDPIQNPYYYCPDKNDNNDEDAANPMQDKIKIIAITLNNPTRFTSDFVCFQGDSISYFSDA
jgi:hypothetical protein